MKLESSCTQGTHRYLYVLHQHKLQKKNTLDCRQDQLLIMSGADGQNYNTGANSSTTRLRTEAHCIFHFNADAGLKPTLAERQPPIDSGSPIPQQSTQCSLNAAATAEAERSRQHSLMRSAFREHNR